MSTKLRNAHVGADQKSRTITGGVVNDGGFAFHRLAKPSEELRLTRSTEALPLGDSLKSGAINRWGSRYGVEKIVKIYEHFDGIEDPSGVGYEAWMSARSAAPASFGVPVRMIHDIMQSVAYDKEEWDCAGIASAASVFLNEQTMADDPHRAALVSNLIQNGLNPYLMTLSPSDRLFAVIDGNGYIIEPNGSKGGAIFLPVENVHGPASGWSMRDEDYDFAGDEYVADTFDSIMGVYNDMREDTADAHFSKRVADALGIVHGSRNQNMDVSMEHQNDGILLTVSSGTDHGEDYTVKVHRASTLEETRVEVVGVQNSEAAFNELAQTLKTADFGRYGEAPELPEAAQVHDLMHRLFVLDRYSCSRAPVADLRSDQIRTHVKTSADLHARLSDITAAVTGAAPSTRSIAMLTGGRGEKIELVRQTLSFSHAQTTVESGGTRYVFKVDQTGVLVCTVDGESVGLEDARGSVARRPKAKQALEAFVANAQVLADVAQAYSDGVGER